MTALGDLLAQRPESGGVEIQPVPGVGWGGYAWASDGWRDLLWTFATHETAEEWVTEFVDGVSPRIIE